MKRFFKELYYSFKLNSFSNLYDIDYLLGEMLFNTLNENIKDIIVDEYYAYIETKSGILVNFRVHKYIYDAWASNGTIKDISRNYEIFSWKRTCISKEYIFKIKELIYKAISDKTNIRGE